MSHPLEPSSPLTVLSPTLPGVPDRLLRSRWLVSGGTQLTVTFTSLTSSHQVFQAALDL